MGLKTAIVWSFFTVNLNLGFSAISHWEAPLSETPETRAIAVLLKVYQTYDANGPIQLRRIGREYDGGYVIPEVAMHSADVVIGYGIGSDISFEESTTAIYGKPSYGFDCTCTPIQTRYKECQFISSCIVSKEFVEQSASMEPFDRHLDRIGARDKKMFIKMDIEGNEYDTVPDILQHACNVTGIVLELHFEELKQVPQALHLLQALNQNFLLVHVHGNNGSSNCFETSNARGCVSRVLELSYINRSLVQKYEISPHQAHPTSIDMPNISHLPDSDFTILD